MQPEIQAFPRRYLAGLNIFGNPFQQHSGWMEENEIGRLWQRYMAYMHQHGQDLPAAAEPGVAYEIHIDHPDTAERGEFEVFVGHLIQDPGEIPAILSVKVLPASLYAVFTLAGEQIVSDWGMEIIDRWLNGSGYSSNFDFNYQRYDERFKGLDRLQECVLEVHVPVEPETV